MKKRVLSILLVMLMVLSLLPTTALAGTDTVFEISDSSSNALYTSWTTDALEKVTYLRTYGGAVTVTMHKDYNSEVGGALDFGSEVFTLDLNGHTLGGTVVNAQNVKVVDNAGTKGTLAATGTFGRIDSDVVIADGLESTSGTSTVTVGKEGVKPYEVSYYKDTDGSSSATDFLGTVQVNPGDSITLRGGADIKDVEVYADATMTTVVPKYAFGGWKTGGNTYEAEGTFKPEGNTIFTVDWTPYHTVTYEVEDLTSTGHR